MKRIVSFILGLFLCSQAAIADELLTLDSFLLQVRAQNLGLKVEAAKSDAAASRAAGIKIPPPMVVRNRMNIADRVKA